MTRGVATGLGCLVGAGVAYVVAIGIYIFCTAVLGWYDREGGWAMGVVFTVGPVFALVVGIVTAVVVSRRSPR